MWAILTLTVTFLSSKLSLCTVLMWRRKFLLAVNFLSHFSHLISSWQSWCFLRRWLFMKDLGFSAHLPFAQIHKPSFATCIVLLWFCRYYLVSVSYLNSVHENGFSFADCLCFFSCCKNHDGVWRTFWHNRHFHCFPIEVSLWTVFKCLLYEAGTSSVLHLSQEILVPSWSRVIGPAVATGWPLCYWRLFHWEKYINFTLAFILIPDF